jgi:hypothetical protein
MNKELKQAIGRHRLTVGDVALTLGVLAGLIIMWVPAFLVCFILLIYYLGRRILR